LFRDIFALSSNTIIQGRRFA